jgi:uncharacterized protein with NAD-binding domain and iron-sulfur cluster
VGEKIFQPWVEAIEQLGGKVETNQRVTNLIVDDNNQARAVVCGDKIFDADGVIFAVGVSGMKKIMSGSSALQSRQEFRNLNNLGGIDVLATRLWFDRKITIPRASNACFGFDATTGWTFFDLNAIHDEFKEEPNTVVEVDFYHANQFLPLEDDEIVEIVKQYLTTCIPAFGEAEIVEKTVVRLSQAVTHFFPGSYQYMLPATTSFKNVFMSGDWIINRHGSWSQEKAYVTGLEAANLAIDLLGSGEKAEIIPVEPDEEHIKILRTVNRSIRELGKSFFPNIWLP